MPFKAYQIESWCFCCFFYYFAYPSRVKQRYCNRFTIWVEISLALSKVLLCGKARFAFVMSLSFFIISILIKTKRPQLYTILRRRSIYRFNGGWPQRFDWYIKFNINIRMIYPTNLCTSLWDVHKSSSLSLSFAPNSHSCFLSNQCIMMISYRWLFVY